MPDKKMTILTKNQIQNKLKRMARQVVEHYHDEGEVYIIGINGRGYHVAEFIAEELKKFSDLNIHLAELSIHKDLPLSKPCELSLDTNELKGKVVIVVDDVLNSGRTLIYAVKYLLDFEPRKMKTAVLVDRRHRKFPIRADWVGITLSTTLEEHIAVDMNTMEAVLG